MQRVPKNYHDKTRRKPQLNGEVTMKSEHWPLWPSQDSRRTSRGHKAVSSCTALSIPALATQYNVTTLGSTSGGHSKVQMINSIWAGSRFSFKGS
jgi:hypothetical protein